MELGFAAWICNTTTFEAPAGCVESAGGLLPTPVGRVGGVGESVGVNDGVGVGVNVGVLVGEPVRMNVLVKVDVEVVLPVVVAV
jgi:hypothetical protein